MLAFANRSIAVIAHSAKLALAQLLDFLQNGFKTIRHVGPFSSNALYRRTGPLRPLWLIPPRPSALPTLRLNCRRPMPVASLSLTSFTQPPLGEGIPTLDEVEAMLARPIWEQTRSFNAAFLERHRRALSGYAWHWGRDPLKFWSRRWEYPFAEQAVFRHAERTERDGLVICDAGSGVTFFPYLLADRLPAARVVCCDYAATYAPIFAAVNRNEPHDRVSFRRAALQDLPFDDGELDVLCCISVLEHTGQYATIVREVARALKPGGRFVLTFDLSQDDKFDLQPGEARKMFGVLEELFDCDAAALWEEAGKAKTRAADLLCTPTIKKRQPELLPWKYPRLQAMYDLVRGYGLTGGFRAAACYCLDVARR